MKVPIHLSTQANTLNSYSCKFWKQYGIKRINLARELSLKEIAEIKENISNIELEIFAHGALCLSFSGKCFLSDFLTKRSANQGKCTHPCRWTYKLIEEKREKEILIVEEGKDYASFFSPYDLMSLEFIKEILSLDIDSLKIEGRMKGAFYTGMVVHIYRKNIDRIIRGEKIDNDDIRRLLYITKRGYGHGFLNKEFTEDLASIVHPRENIPENAFIGIIESIKNIRNNPYIKLKLKNNLSVSDECEIITREKEIRFIAEEILDDGFNIIDYGKPNSFVYIKFDKQDIRINDIIYKL